MFASVRRLGLALGLVLFAAAAATAQNEPLFDRPIDVRVPHISTDPSVRWDYDIVYVRGPRAGDEIHKRFYTDIATPVTLEPGCDLMLLRPDGSEEVLVKAEPQAAVTDPFVSFDGQWVYYTYIYSLAGAGPWSMPRRGADIFKIHVPTRKIVRLTNQKFTPNLGAADWSRDFRTNESHQKTYYEYGVLNFGPCPLPGGRIVFTTNRDGFRPQRGYPQIALQLFVMDDRDESIGDDEEPRNLEKIGHLNIAGALHPVVLTDGRILFSSLESQGIRGEILWGIWSILPDGTQWNPVISAFDPGGAPNAFHFQTQLSDGSIVVEEYYNQNNSGFGTYIKLPLSPPEGYAAFGPGDMRDPRNKPWRFGRHDNGKARWYRMPFMPTGSEVLTPFTHAHDGPADPSILGDKSSPRVGKYTHPSGAPDNHLLTIYSPGPTNHQYKYLPQLDGGIYLIKDGRPIEEPAQMLLIKNDPNYNEQWPRALVPYERIYGIPEPANPPALANDGARSPQLPAGAPFGLIGTSSLYKRESYPNGSVPDGQVTAEYPGGNDPWRGLDAFTSHGNGMPINWHNQGADAGLYTNDDIHAVRILAMEPTTDRHRGPKSGRLFRSHAQERLRILGEIPVRKFTDGQQPTDPDGHPDTSFLAKIPADTAFTFQTIDRHGLVLNMAQTWHQLRAGEVRTDCGGCHAHSQAPTHFADTAAAQPGYALWDLTQRTPLVTSKSHDESKRQWAAADDAGLRYHDRPVADVEYFRDIQPILARSCVACHTKESASPPAGLALDTDDETIDNLPGAYYRLAADEKGRFGVKPVGYDSWGYPQASRYIRKLQARRSVLVWKLFGERLDGFSNDDHPSESPPGSGVIKRGDETLPVDRYRARVDLDYIGSQMPPPDAVAGRWRGSDGQPVHVPPVTDEERRTIARWIDLGCPIELDADAAARGKSFGWFSDDNRPVLTLAEPTVAHRGPLARIVVGAYDYYSGLDGESLTVTADFAIDGAAAGENLAGRFQPTADGVWEYRLARPATIPAGGVLTVRVADRQGNVTHVERTFRGP